MAKVMLVEDDNNLREIYEARLLAEGYEIVSARDGEEALALAVKEKPDLIIADIMMPKISGFDMLDILRSTPETKNSKVIMMTALSQAEDKDRANKLGADRYLVKSQVTLEDVARVAREVLGGEAPAPLSIPGSPPPDSPPTDLPTPPPPTPTPTDDSTSGSTTTTTSDISAQSIAEEEKAVRNQIEAVMNQPIATAPNPEPTPTAEPVVEPTEAAQSQPAAENHKMVGMEDQPKPATPTHTKVIKPLNDLSKTGPNLEALLAKEEAKEMSAQQETTAAIGQPVVEDIKGKKGSSGDKPALDPNSIAI